MVNVLKLSAFSNNGKGGNPAGVVFYDEMPGDDEMLKVAKQVGYSETAFLVKQGMAGECVILRRRWKSLSAGMPLLRWARCWANALGKANTDWF